MARIPHKPGRPMLRATALVVSFALTSTFALAAQNPATPHPSTTTTTQLIVRILNAQTNKPVLNERLNYSFYPDQIGYRLSPTDKAGLVHLTPAPDRTVVRILTNFYADCRPRAELYTNYTLAEIRSSGITTGNLCSAAHPAPKPGELLLFVIPKNAIRTFGQPPSSNLPHSDENPHTTTDNPITPPPIESPTPPPSTPPQP